MQAFNLQKLLSRLEQPLPGRTAQLKMAPAQRREELERIINLKNAKESAVLIILFEKELELHTLFIHRSEYDGTHSGQIAFPGGKKDTSDKDLVITALRETHEELGIQPSKFQILGPLTELYIPPSNFLIKPFVAYHTGKPHYEINPQEVQSVIEVKMSDLENLHHRTSSEFYVSGSQTPITAPCFQVQGFKIWGATAMIVSELLEILAE
jgi:8-oxo-dGTP pyrophosphatase MutT (NUDIX family)